jgi:hypothetical protein
MPPEYVAYYGGQETTCPCGASVPIPLPQSPAANASPALLPYRAPAVQQETAGGLFADGALVVVTSQSHFPPHCCVCNEPVAGPMRGFDLSWEEMGRNIGRGSSLGGGGGSYAGFPQFVVTLQVGFCRSHRLRRWWKAWISLGCALGAAAWVALASALEDALPRSQTALFIFPAGALTFAALVTLAWRGPFRIERKHDDAFWVKGFGRAYVQSLPSWSAYKAAEYQAIGGNLGQIVEE